tara:strand:+ start:3020 stop:3652 length:633 start_codon:yes stop_codon:yes gene_type:complete
MFSRKEEFISTIKYIHILTMVYKKRGVIYTLKKTAGGKLEDKNVESSLGTLNLCPDKEFLNAQNYFSRIFSSMLTPDDEDKTVNTEIRFYRDTKPNTKGTYIYDFDVRVNNKKKPFGSMDQVDYFLSNYVGFVENQRLIEKGDKGAKDPKYYFNNILKVVPHYPANVPPDYEEDEEKEELNKKGGKKHKSIKKLENKKRKTLKNKKSKKE